MFVLAGRYVEVRSKRRAGAALRALLELGAKDVAVLRDGTERRIPIAELRTGDEFVVRPGEKVATDGVVVSGVSAIDASLVTGESVPVEARAGDSVIGATLNAGGRLVVRATRVGADTQLAQMARLVEEAQSGKARAQRLADRISGVFVPIVLVLAVGTLGAWLALGSTRHPPSPPPSRCSSSRARAPSDSRHRRRCWSARGAEPSSASSSRAGRARAVSRARHDRA